MDSGLQLRLAGSEQARETERSGPLAAASDEALMGVFREGADERAFEELARRYAAVACRTAAALLGAGSAAEDAAQECFLRLVRARRSYRRGKPFRAWFFAILRNVCRDELRRKPLDPTGLTGLTSPTGPDPHAASERREEALAARRAFERLAEPDREILALRVHSGLGFPEIGRLCGLSAEAAKKRAARALERLRRELD